MAKYLSKAKLNDLIKYCALSTYGTYSAYELMAQTKKYDLSIEPTMDDVQNVIDNLEKADFIYKADSIPAPVYVTLQPELWREEATNFLNGVMMMPKGDAIGYNDNPGDIPGGVSSNPVKATKSLDISGQVDHAADNPAQGPKKSRVDKSKPVPPTNSTLTVNVPDPIIPEPKPQVTESVKQAPPVNKLKQRWYEAHKDEQ